MQHSRNIEKNKKSESNLNSRKSAFTLAEVFSKHFTGSRKSAFTLAEVFSPHSASSRKHAFTLAEVLITLSIIGVVAAMTLPSIIQNVQKHVLKNQFKKAYSTFSQGVFKAQSQLDMPVNCSYWLDGPPCKTVCSKYNSYNTCVEIQCENGSNSNIDLSKATGDCAVFEEELFNRVFKIVKFCENNALANGCITSEYRGSDKVLAEKNPDTNYNPNSDFSDINIKNKFSSWILVDGTVIIKYGKYKGDYPVYTIDINGHKKPNKWGYDIFTFVLKGNNDGIKKISGSYIPQIDMGGKWTEQMIQEMN